MHTWPACREALQKALTQFHPSVYMVERRWLRRIIRRFLNQPAAAGPAIHEFAFPISRLDLVCVIEPTEAGLPPEAQLPEQLLLMPELTEDEFNDNPKGWWQRFERGILHWELDKRFDEKFSEIKSLKPLQAWLTESQRKELMQVMVEQHLLVDTQDQRLRYKEAASTFLELAYFAEDRLSEFFPGLSEYESLKQQLEMMLESAELPQLCRLQLPAEWTTRIVSTGLEQQAKTIQPGFEPRILQAERTGNQARAVWLRWQSGDTAAAKVSLQSFAERLQNCLPLPNGWLIPLERIIQSAPEGEEWSLETRILVDLQKICEDKEKPIYAVEVMEALITRGAKPVTRLLDRVPHLRMLRHLRKVQRRLHQLPDKQDDLISFTHDLHDAELSLGQTIRTELRPQLYLSLNAVNLTATDNSPAQMVAREALVDQLLDRIVARGFLSVSDVRDAIAQNNLKMPDLSSPAEFLQGDQLIQLNRKLPFMLDGIYHRGEFYLRLFQRFSSLFFGTGVGRILTLWLLLPFGGAFVFLEGSKHFYEAMEGAVRFVSDNPNTEKLADSAMKEVYHALPMRKYLGNMGRYLPEEHTWATPFLILTVGTFFVLLLHLPELRQGMVRLLRWLFLSFPKWILDSKLVQLVLFNPLTSFFRHYCLVPLAFGSVAGISARFAGISFPWAMTLAFFFAGLTAVFFRTRRGREWEEWFDEGVEQLWRGLSLKFLYALAEWILHSFRWILETIERGIYAVDDWLRYREGENKLSYAFKYVFGIGWFFVTYIFRFCWNLLVEPQINPIKHFPVVTVSHKLLLPMVPSLSEAFGTTLARMTTIVSTIPGVFGFLAWELKENWKLYRRNRKEFLSARSIGSHGESIYGLLNPGFHSGTIPKTFAKLRNAQSPARRAYYQAELHHLEEAIHNWCERYGLSYLKHSRRWNGRAIPAAHIHLATNQIFLHWKDENSMPFFDWIIEFHEGWLIVDLKPGAGYSQLQPQEQEAWLDVVTGLLSDAGIDFVRQQGAWTLGCLPSSFQILEGELRIYEAGTSRPVAYPEVFFTARPIAIQEWENHWTQEADRVNVKPLRLSREMLRLANGSL